MATSTITSNADYIVEQGTSGIWTYRKWNSGIAECWGVRTQNVTFLNVSGYCRETLTGVSLPSGVFNATPTVLVSMGSTVWGSAVATKDAIGSTYCYDIVTGTINNLPINYYLIGRWK